MRTEGFRFLLSRLKKVAQTATSGLVKPKYSSLCLVNFAISAMQNPGNKRSHIQGSCCAEDLILNALALEFVARQHM